MAKTLTIQTWYDLSIEERRSLLTLDKGAENRKATQPDAEAIRALVKAGYATKSGEELSKRGRELLDLLPADTRNPLGRPSEMSGTIGVLALILGGAEKLASEIGVSIRTLQRYAAKTVQIPGPARKALERLANAHNIKNPSF